MDLNKDGKTNWHDIALAGTFITVTFNFVLGFFSFLGLGLSFTSNNTPVLDCKTVSVDGKYSLQCFRPDATSPNPTIVNPN